MRRLVGIVLLVMVVGFVGLQLVPYGHDHANPPATADLTWDSQATRDLAVRACFDCHSNETVWPWYSNVAPVSWLVQRHVNEGRQKLNFSTGRGELERAGQMIACDTMPTGDYMMMHPEARLTDGEKQQLIDGLVKSFGMQAVTVGQVDCSRSGGDDD